MELGLHKIKMLFLISAFYAFSSGFIIVASFAQGLESRRNTFNTGLRIFASDTDFRDFYFSILLASENSTASLLIDNLLLSLNAFLREQDQIHEDEDSISGLHEEEKYHYFADDPTLTGRLEGALESVQSEGVDEGIQTHMKVEKIVQHNEVSDEDVKVLLDSFNAEEEEKDQDSDL